MPHNISDGEFIRTHHNLARYCVENRTIAWVLLIATVLWGVYGFLAMPQRKDPNIPSTEALAVTPWPGVTAEKIEQLVTRQVEDKIAENPNIHRATAGYYGIKSMTLSGRSFVWVNLEDSVSDTKKEFNDINLKLKDLDANLPDGAGPVQFKSDFGDTAALMLTVASPKADAMAVALRARSIQEAIAPIRRAAASSSAPRFTIVYNFPPSANPRLFRMARDFFGRFTIEQGVARDLRFIEGTGFVGVDAEGSADDAAIMAHLDRFVQERLRGSEIHPDAWKPVIIRNPEDTESMLLRAAGDKYTYRELDDFTDLIQRTLQGIPQVSKVTRSGVLQETIYLNYSQERLAAYGIALTGLSDILRARNITQPGGMFEVRGKNLAIAPSGEFHSQDDIGGVLINVSSSGNSVYLRDLVDMYRGYEAPPKFLNTHSRRTDTGEWERTRAVTLAVQMRPGEQIGRFGQAVDAALAELKHRLPKDLILARTSDQPRQVEENVHLFMDVLMDAVILVILVSWIGFWEWRSALLMALAIPITLAMTFGMMNLLGIDIQQVSIASLIIALGLLVDDPVVAGDAIKRDLAAGHRPVVASWLGPTKLATVILYATVTNIVAYLPFLLLTGKTGQFLYSLPVVITCSLVASRLVSMTFIPFLGYYLLRPTREPSLEERKRKGFIRLYYKVGGFALDHRWAVLAGSVAFLALGLLFLSQLKTQFFPKDLAYLSYVNVWLPADAPLSATSETARLTESLIIQAAADYARIREKNGDRPRDVLKSLTSFIGGGAPRFWYTLGPEQQQLNYAQIIMETEDKHDTTPFIDYLQPLLSAGIPGARIEALQLESAKPVGTPVAIRVSGENLSVLRRSAEELKAIFRSTPTLTRIRDDWGEDTFTVRFDIDPDRANLAGVSNFDVAASAAAGISGYQVTTLREGHRQIPVVLRLRVDERAQLADLHNLYVFSSQGTAKVPLGQVSNISYQMEAQKLRRREHFRTITAEAYPIPGVLSSEAMRAIRPRLAEFKNTLPPGYQMQIGGEEESQIDGFKNLGIVMAISIAAIFLALVFQFKNAVKPLLVFAAIPYGMVGALAALYVMHTPFGFMAFMGVASLVGVIVSHIIVLFEFIEERHALGEPFREAMLDSGILRLRPVLITVGATVIALFPLAYRGGPLWEPMCYTQIGGLLLATIITKILIPVLYAIFVQDLKILKWEEKNRADMDDMASGDGDGDGALVQPAAALPAAPSPTA
ncbi:efflux RND transporter permease subunit [Nitrospira sp. Nam80]